jgi:internalin A
VLLVGEGNVGKSSLIPALRHEAFVENRPTTHGIEIGQLVLPHLDRAASRPGLTLNIWDFGGQEVCRIIHQFFFSRRALYLLVWRPREGVRKTRSRHGAHVSGCASVRTRGS